MGNDKFTLPKSTAANHSKTTTESASANLEAIKSILPAKDTDALKTPVEAMKATESSKSGLETITTAVHPAGLEVGMQMADSSNAAELMPAQTKMEVATEIYKRMKKVKDITRKEILDEFVAEAKLSKAGASTYYQLIKAKVK